MMKKRMLALLFTLCLALSLAACSSGGSGRQTSQPQEAPQTQEQAPSESTETPAQPEENSEEDAEAPEVNESGLRPAKTAEDPIFDEDTQEILSYMAKSISEEYLVPNGISQDDFAWPTDQAAWDYYKSLLDAIYFKITLDADRPIDETLIPASPDREIMDAASKGVADWLNKFESVESVYLDHLYVLLKNSEYIQDYFTFE